MKKDNLAKRRGASQEQLLLGAAWYAACPRYMKKKNGADFMVWSYLLIWVGAFD